MLSSVLKVVLEVVLLLYHWLFRQTLDDHLEGLEVDLAILQQAVVGGDGLTIIVYVLDVVVSPYDLV